MNSKYEIENNPIRRFFSKRFNQAKTQPKKHKEEKL